MQTETVTNEPNVILDVVDFLDEVIDEYSHFADEVLNILAKTSKLTPLQVESECQRLKNQRDALQGKDNQLLEVLKLGGTDLMNHQLLDNYRIASADAAKACDLLKEELEFLQLSIPETQLP